MSQSDNVAQKLPNFVFECLNKSFSTNCKRSYYFQAYFLILFVFEKKMLFCNFEKIIKNIIWKRSSSSLHRINCFFFLVISGSVLFTTLNMVNEICWAHFSCYFQISWFIFFDFESVWMRDWHKLVSLWDHTDSYFFPFWFSSKWLGAVQINNRCSGGGSWLGVRQKQCHKKRRKNRGQKEKT